METVETPAVVTAPRVVAIKFRNAGRTYDYDAGSIELVRGDQVVVEFGDTQVVGTVVRTQLLSPTASTGHPKIVRRIGEDDRAKLERMRAAEVDAFKFALVKLRARNLPAKMVAVEISFLEDKMTFYVASEERIDLRAWIRDVSTQFRARVDVRQIGARDAAKFIGGIGSCGRELCCSTWLVDFRPVSIKMAKDQNLALNPEKVSGQCGRLLCCLTYEQDTYRDMRKGLPKIGKRVYTPMGDGRVKDVNVLRRRVRVQLIEGYEEFDAEQVSPMFGQKGELLEPNFGPARADVFADDDDAEESTDESGVSSDRDFRAPRQERRAEAFDRPRAPAHVTPRPEGEERAPSNERPRDERGPRQDRGPNERGGRERDRGPRQDRGPNDRGGRERDRGPRPDRGPNDRGPRREGDRGPRREGDRGPRNEGDRGPRQDRGPNDRGGRDRGPRQDRDRGGRRDGRPDGGPRPEGAPGSAEGAPSQAFPPAGPPRHEGDRLPTGERPEGDDTDADDGPDDDGAPADNRANAPRDPNAPPREGGRRRRRRRGGRGGRGGGGGQGGGGGGQGGGGGGQGGGQGGGAPA